MVSSLATTKVWGPTLMADVLYELMRACDNVIQDRSWSDRDKELVLHCRQLREEAALKNMSPGQQVARSFRPSGQDGERLTTF